MLGDLELVKLVKDGSLEAFEALISKYKDRVYNIAFSFTANHSDSDDITQNVFLKIYLNLNCFEEKSAFSTWLYRITVNECYSGLKKRKNNMISLDTRDGKNENGSLKDTIEDKNDDIEKGLISKEIQTEIRKAILELPEKYRIIITLKDIENMTYEEISRIMDISTNKVKIWLFRSRNRLKNILAQKANNII